MQRIRLLLDLTYVVTSLAASSILQRLHASSADAGAPFDKAELFDAVVAAISQNPTMKRF